MFEKIRQAFHGLETLSVDREGRQVQDDLRLATAVLILEMAQVDGSYSIDEGQAMFRSLGREFALSNDSTHRLVALAQQNVRGREQIDEFVQIINDHFDDTQKQRILALVWKVISADGITSDRESAFAVRLREKLHLSMEQALRARRMAEEASDLTKEEAEPLGHETDKKLGHLQ